MSFVDLLEPRRLFNLAAGDPSFGSGGMVRVGAPTNSPLFDESRPALTALADGRSILVGSVATTESPRTAVIRYLRADGSLDTKRGNGDGIIYGGDSIGFNPAVAVEPGTGRVAVVTASYDAKANLRLKVDLYDPLGREGRYVTSHFITGVRPNYGDSVSMAFAPDGGLAIAAFQTSPGDSPHSAVYIYRLDKSLKSINSFNGVGQVLISVDQPYTVDSPSVDSKGRVSVALHAGNLEESATARAIERIVRVTSKGSRDKSWGTKGILTIYDEPYKRTGQTKKVATLDRVAASDGTIYLLTNAAYNTETGGFTSSLQLRRIGTDGKMTSIQVGRTEGASEGAYGQLAIGPDGNLYVASRLHGSAEQVWRYAADKNGKLTSVDSWSDFGDSVQTQLNFGGGGILAVDHNGAVMLAGQLKDADNTSTVSVYRFKGTTTYAKTKEGSVSLLGDGTILVKGTSKSDTIDIERGDSVHRVRVLFNGKAKDFAANRVSGLLIQGGKGDDKIFANDFKLAMYVEGGDGNDKITGTDNSDTLVGNGGNDTLDGNDQFGADHLYGQDGNDTLFGRGGLDELFGGAGNDRLYASGGADDTRTNDVARDLLDGGKGADLIVMDTPGVNFYRINRDVLGTVDSDDTIKGG